MIYEQTCILAFKKKTYVSSILNNVELLTVVEVAEDLRICYCGQDFLIGSFTDIFYREKNY